MTESDLLKRGRQAFRQQEWQKAFTLLTEALQRMHEGVPADSLIN